MLKKFFLSSLILSSFVSLDTFAENSNLKVAPDSSHLSVFNAYCLNSEDSFNISSNLIKDNWISEKDNDLIKNNDYRKLFKDYSNAVNKNKNDKINIYTQELKSGVVFISVLHNISGCSVKPFEEYGKDDIIKFLSKRNISLDNILEEKEGNLTINFYSYKNQLVSITESRNENLTYIMSMLPSESFMNNISKLKDSPYL